MTFVGDLTDTDHDVAGKVYILDQDTLVVDEFSFDNNGFGVYINVATKGRNKKQWAKNRIDVPYPSGGFQRLRHCCDWLSPSFLFHYILSDSIPKPLKKDEADRIDSGTEGEPIEKLYKGDGQLIIDLKQVKILIFGRRSRCKPGQVCGSCHLKPGQVPQLAQ